MKTFLLNIALVLVTGFCSIAVTAQPGDPQARASKKTQTNSDTQSNTRIPLTNDPAVIRQRDTLPIPPPQPPIPTDTIRKQ